jgi:hypothetical protein
MAPLMAAGPGRRSGRWRREPERSIGVPAIKEEPRLRRVVFDDTIAHKGSVEDAAKAAGRSAVVNTATGVIPLGVIMPVQEAAPGMMGLVAAKLPQVSLFCAVLFCAVLAPSSSSAQASACLRCVLEARDAYEDKIGAPLRRSKPRDPLGWSVGRSACILSNIN